MISNIIYFARLTFVTICFFKQIEKGQIKKMKLEEFNYDLPKELIAQHPIEKRDESRLMVLDRENQSIEHKTFKNIIEYLNQGDCLVINDTKVIPARIYGVKKYDKAFGFDTGRYQ